MTVLRVSFNYFEYNNNIFRQTFNFLDKNHNLLFSFKKTCINAFSTNKHFSSYKFNIHFLKIPKYCYHIKKVKHNREREENMRNQILLSVAGLLGQLIVSKFGIWLGL